MKVILIAGQMYAGKTYTAFKLLREFHSQYELSCVYSFANNIKLFFKQYFNLTKEKNLNNKKWDLPEDILIEYLNDYFGYHKEFETSKHVKDLLSYINNCLNNHSYNDNIRKCYQIFGTEIGRNIVNKNIWVNFAIYDINNLNAQNIIKNVIIDDWRFPNEYFSLKNKIDSNIKIEKIFIHARPDIIQKRTGYIPDNKLNHESEKYLNELMELSDRIIYNNE